MAAGTVNIFRDFSDFFVTVHGDSADSDDFPHLTWTALKPKTVLALIIKMLENQDVFHTTNGILQQLELSPALNYLIYFT